MKITIDVSEFWLDEDDLEEGLKQFIINEAVIGINKSIKEKVEKQITITVSKLVNDQVAKHIYETAQRIIDNETFKGSYSTDPPITFEEKIRKVIKEGSGRSNGIDQVVKMKAETIINELKTRYDLFFAAQIVNKMSDNGMLKDEKLLELIDPKFKKQ